MPVCAEGSATLAQGIGILSEYKSNAEQQARILVGLVTGEDITKENYRKGQSLYAEAKASFDGWIDQVIFEVQAGKTEMLSPQYEIIQKTAKAKGDAFTQFVREQFLGNPRGEIGESFKSMFAKIQEVGQLIFQGLRQASSPDKTETIRKLETYKWSPFHLIEQSI